MSTLLSQAQEKLQNTESSMKFMQAEHAHTLHGLHDEIHKLQTKCSGKLLTAQSLCSWVLISGHSYFAIISHCSFNKYSRYFPEHSDALQFKIAPFTLDISSTIFRIPLLCTAFHDPSLKAFFRCLLLWTM